MTSRQVGAERRVQASEHVSYKRFDTEIVLVDLNRGEYFSLDDIGGRMWEQLMAGKTPGEIAVCLASEYEAASEVILRDCEALIEELLRRGLLTLRNQ